MLYAIRTNDQEKINARDTSKGERPFACPSCLKEVYVRKGDIKIHHFAHKPPVTCMHGFGESEKHRECKTAIHAELLKHPDVSRCELECRMGSVIPDVYAIIRNIHVAIEVQISTLSVREITRRTKYYQQLGVAVLWLPVHRNFLIGSRYAPKAWERWLHATYFGRVYYWVKALDVFPVHFDPYFLYVEESSWYDEDGEECSGGGYFRTSKRYKTPIQGRHVDIASAFRPIKRKSWQGGSFSIPDCLLYQNTQPVWWETRDSMS